MIGSKMLNTIYNWYNFSKNNLPFAKIAQIWSYDADATYEFDDADERTFGSLVKEVYVLEYKYSMLKLRPFTGIEKRRENMLRKLEERLLELFPILLKQIEKTLSNWLESHALLSPNTWANKVVEKEAEFAEDEGTRLSMDAMLSEYVRYKSGRLTLPTQQILYRAFLQIIAEVTKNLNSFPVFSDWISTMYLPDYKEMLKSEIHYNLQDFNLNRSKNFKTIEDAEDFVDSLTLKNTDLDLLNNLADDPESLMNMLGNSGKDKMILTELYQYFVFPYWYKYWKEKGIEQTRKTIEKILNIVQNAQNENIEQMFAATSLGLQSAHQTGEMIYYIQEDTHDENLKKDLEWATDGKFVEEANRQLKAVGVSI